MPPAIALEGVSKIYGSGPPALDNVSLAVEEGEFVALVGQSGSGKSTLLGTINGLIRPTQGIVRFWGENVASLDPVRLRRSIGYVFQDIGLFPHMSLAENIAITPKLLGWDHKRRVARADELLQLMQLAPETYRDRFPAALSGGQRQRVAVARAIAAEPQVVLMDEPFGALDLLTREALSRDYRALHERLGLTTIMITHDVIEAVLLADRIGVLHGGRLMAYGRPQEIANLSDHAEVRALLQMPLRQAEHLTRRMREGA